MRQRDGIAIVGMGCIFPGAPDLGTYWSNIVEGIDSIQSVPETRWDPLYYDPQAAGVDRFYCRRGGFLDAYATIDPTAFGLMPMSAGSTEPDQLVTLVAAKQALDDAGGTIAEAVRERTAVIVGRTGHPTVPLVRLDQRVRTSEQLVASLRSLQLGLSDEDLELAKKAFVDQLGPFRPESAVGISTNFAASRVANRLDLHGPAYTVDAACASAILAIDHGCAELASRRCDLVLAGGVSLCDDVTLWSAFTQLGAISPSEMIRPFDRRADGLLIGEGVGILVLQRLEEAEEEGRRIYAVLRGTGIASDGRATTLMAPDASGQVRALERAWAEAAMDPSETGLLEAHGTATPAGDAAELETVRRFFGANSGGPTGVIGSVKSMIGHSMAAAGAAGLIKAVLSVHHGVLPPTLHCEEPQSLLSTTTFRPIGEAIDWPRNRSSRVAAVNAFGFGGINSHAVLESHRTPVGRARHSERRPQTMVPRAVRTPDRSLLRQNAIFLGAADRAGLLDQLRDPAPGVPSEDGTGIVRLAIVDPTPEKLEFARKIVDRGRPWRGRRDVWFSADGLVSRGGKVAFLFPGIEGEIRADVADIAARYGWDTPASLYDQASPDDVEALARVSLELSLFCYSALCELGVAPNVVAGQSIGEWAGLVAAEVVPPEALDAFVATLDPQSFDFPDVVYAAIGTDVATVEAEIADLDRVEITHDNCPHQTIVCGPEGDVTVALDRLKARRVFGSLLPFRSGFHGSLIVPYLSPFEAAIARVPLQPGRIPIWSATSCEPYPEDPSGIRALELAHLSQRVRFRELVRRLFDDGVRCFVQVGAGSLPGFVEDTLRGEDFLQTSCIAAKRRGLEQLLRVASALWVEGASGIRLNELLPGSAASGPAASAHPAVHRIQLGLPLVRIAPGAIPAPSRALPTGLLNGTTPPSAASPTSGRRDGDRLAGAFHSLLGDLEAAASEVLAAASAPAGTNQREAPRSIVRPLELSLDRFPCLYDHSLVHVPEDWPNDVDRFAVVPLTMALELMLEAAGELCPGLVAVGVEDVVATRWLEVAPPVTVQTVATLVQGRPGSAAPERPTQRVDVSIDGYCRCTAIFAPSYAAAPPRRAEPLQGVVSQMATPEEVYGTGELFHGPAYRGLLTLGPAGENGLDAVVTGSAAPGALLDNAGQVVGCWICFSASVNRVAFPVAIERIDFYGPKPLPGEHCTVKMRVVTCMANSIRVTAEFSTDEGLWAHIDGWEERRFESDQTIWSFVTDPTNHLLGEPREGGWMLASEHWRTAASRDLISRTVLTQSERADYHQRRGADQRQWLLGRIAAKDAVRRWCTLRGYRRLHPLEVQITNDPLGRPLAVTPFDIDLHISLAHTRWVAVALAGDRDVGIDIERVEARSESFLRATFEEAEQKVLLEGTGSPEETATRFTTGWSAKEAVAKATGHGLGGRPKDFVISKVDGSRLWVNGVATDSAREGDWVIVWTTHDEPAEGVER